MATAITPTVHQVLSVLLMELITGQLTDETIAAVDHLDLNDVPAPMHEVVAFMHGMSTTQPMRYHITTSLIRILGAELLQMVDQREKEARPIRY